MNNHDESKNSQNVKRILVIKHGAFGDIIQANGILKNIRLHHQGAKITLLTTQNFFSLMETCPYIDNIIIDNRAPLLNFWRQVTLFRKLYQQRFSLIYDLQNSSRTFIYRKFFLFFARWISTKCKHHPISGLRGLVEMLAANNISTQDALKPDISWLANDVSKLLKKEGVAGKYVVLIPGSSLNHPEKRWPYYNELAKLFMKDGIQVVTILGPDERELKKSSSGTLLSNLTWADLAGVIKSSVFIIGNDTGPIHVASCLGKPGVAIFGPTTSGLRSELKRRHFDVIKVEVLSELSATQMHEKILNNKAYKMAS